MATTIKSFSNLQQAMDNSPVVRAKLLAELAIQNQLDPRRARKIYVGREELNRIMKDETAAKYLQVARFFLS